MVNGQSHHDRLTVGARDGSEVKIGRVDDALIGRYHRDAEVGLIGTVEEDERLFIPGRIFFQSRVREFAAFTADFYLDLIVFERHEFFRSFGGYGKIAEILTEPFGTHRIG